MSMIASFAIFTVIAAVAFGAFLILDYYQSQPLTNTNTQSAVQSIEQNLVAQSQLKQFSTNADLVAFLEESSVSENYYGYGSGMMIEQDMMVAPIANETTGLSTADLKEARDYSETNIQVAGVDEGDIVKTDGQYIYTITGNDVVILDATDLSSPKIVSRLTFDSAPRGLYIYNNILVVYGNEGNVYEIMADSMEFGDTSTSPIRESSSYSFVTTYNLEDITKPAEIRNVSIEGDYYNSRMINDVVYLITTESAYVYDSDYPIPMLLDNGRVMPLTGKGCNCPEMYYIDAPYQSQIFTSITAVPVTEPDAEIGQELFVLESAENVYVSQNNLYLAYTKYINEYELLIEAQKEVVIPQMSAEDQQKIKDIENSPAHVLTQSEKDQKILILINSFLNSTTSEVSSDIEDDVTKVIEHTYKDIALELEKTVIHKISLNGTNMKLDASGEVVGHVLNQFSMDEQNGNLRVATTKNREWSSFDIFNNDSYNNVYVLDENLDVIGKVENLAEGEQIYSVRFMQDRAYIVTFRQTDPLFAIDLTTPTKPVVLGQLKVPGFSSYLHPYDDNTLIGFGKQADDNGRVTGLKLSLFDVSDVNNLQEIDMYEFEGSWNDSIALTDHKAFLFSKDKNLLVVPVTLYDQAEAELGYYNTVSTNGAAVFTITKEGFTYRDQIDHSDGTSSDNISRGFYDYSYYDTVVKRSMYIEDYLFTFSTKYLQSHALDTLVEEATILLQQ